MARFTSTWTMMLLGQILVGLCWPAGEVMTQQTRQSVVGSGSPVIPVGSDPNGMANSGNNFGTTKFDQGRPNQMPRTTPPSQPLAPNQGITSDSADDLLTIKNNMLGGVEAIRDSIVGLIAFLIGGAKHIVDKQVQGVMDTVHRVENKTMFIKNNLQSAGGAIVHTWGDSFRQTGNITGQLFGGGNIQRKK